MLDLSESAQLTMCRVPRTRALTLIFFLLASMATSQILSEGPDLDATRRLVVMIDCKINKVPTQGAGIVFGVKDGWAYIATAYHVVGKGGAQPSDLRVQFWKNEKRSFPAEYLGGETEDDLAVLRVKAPDYDPPNFDFPFVRASDLRDLKKSSVTYAIGHPNGEDLWNVTYQPGAISAIDQNLSIESVSIKPGYSGGALINERKMIIGMVLNSDGTTAHALRIDTMASVLRRRFKLKVEFPTPFRGTVYTESKGFFVDGSFSSMGMQMATFEDVPAGTKDPLSKNVRFSGATVADSFLNHPHSFFFPDSGSPPNWLAADAGVVTVTFPSDIRKFGFIFNSLGSDVLPNDTLMVWTLISESGMEVDSGSQAYDFRPSRGQRGASYLGVESKDPFRAVKIALYTLSTGVRGGFNWVADDFRFF
jgi:S1-C subfamily serine protease